MSNNNPTKKAQTNRVIEALQMFWVQLRTYEVLVGMAILVGIAPTITRMVGQAGRAAALTYQQTMAYIPFELYVRLNQLRVLAIALALIIALALFYYEQVIRNR